LTIHEDNTQNYVGTWPVQSLVQRQSMKLYDT